MALPKTLLVPTDFGPGSDHAIAYAAELARAFGAELVLVHSWELPTLGFPDGTFVATTELVKQTESAAQAGVHRAVAALAQQQVRARGLLRQGASSEAIVACAAEVGAEMIVMATHGRTGVTRALLGSVAEKVVRTAHIPVLTIRDPEAPAAG